MNPPIRQKRTRVVTLLAGTLMGLILSRSLGALAQEAKPGPPSQPSQPSPSSPAEPFAPAASMARAAAYLDEASLAWTRQHRCGTCHTNYPYLAARPALKEFDSPAMAEVR